MFFLPCALSLPFSVALRHGGLPGYHPEMSSKLFSLISPPRYLPPDKVLGHLLRSTALFQVETAQGL